MKKNLLSALVLSGVFTFAQNTGVGTTTPYSTLEIKGKATIPTAADGLIIPKISKGQLTAKTAYGNNQVGSIIHVTDSSGLTNSSTTSIDAIGFYFWDGTLWQKLSGNDWSLTGNSNVDAAKNFIGSINSADVIFKRNNLVSGRISANATTFGYSALPTTTAQGFNTAYGSYSMEKFANAGNGGNVAIGHSTLQNYVNGQANTALGHMALQYLVGDATFVTDNQNTAVGHTALRYLTTGRNNTALGQEAGIKLTSGSNNILIGIGAKLPSYIDAFTDYTASNEMSIGNSIYGKYINDNIATNDLIGIGVTNPSVMLDVGGMIRSRMIFNNGGQLTDRVVVADDTGILRSVSRSEFASPYTAGTGITITGTTIAANGLEKVTIAGLSGWKLIGIPKTVIGSQAVDLSSNFGSATGASGVSSFTSGIGTQASGSWSTAMGASSFAESQFETSIGGNGTRDANPEPTGFTNYNKRLFNIGNSFNSSAKSDAFTILRSAKVGIGYSNFETTSADARLNVNGAIKIGTNQATSSSNGQLLGGDMPCNSNNLGTIKFENDNFYGCKSTGWVQLNN